MGSMFISGSLESKTTASFNCAWLEKAFLRRKETIGKTEREFFSFNLKGHSDSQLCPGRKVSSERSTGRNERNA